MKSCRPWLCAGLALAFAWPVLPVRGDNATTNAASGTTPLPTAASLAEKAQGDEAAGKHELALSEVSSALSLDPHNVAALDLRGSIYVEEKLWNRAEHDYTTLNQFKPDPAYRYKLAQIQLLQKHYDDARPLYAALKDDTSLGDLARYKVFICDLFGAHESIAATDLGELDTTGQKPSYYFGRGVWALFHDQNPEAARLFAQGEGRFSDNVVALYAEVIANAHSFQPSVATFVTRDGRKFDQSRVFLESDGLRVSSDTGWVTLPLNQLPDDLTPFPEDMRERIRLRRATVPAAIKLPDAQPISFTTRSGKAYRLVRWRLGDAGLNVLSANGWILIPFEDLPADLSSLPDDLQKQIAQKSAKATAFTSSSTLVSFTTREGQSYDSVHASLRDDDLLVLTTDGWVTIPFTELSVDLSPFPASWRPMIQARLSMLRGEANDSATVSFTTREGKAYREVHATLGGDGVMLATTDGLVNVLFADLPIDLSPFPTGWRPLIERGLKNSDDNVSLMRTVSFTTKRGKNYDQVRAQLDDSGLRALGPDGWVLVPYDQLPDDLSNFPEGWRKAIAQRLKVAAKTTAGSQPN